MRKVLFVCHGNICRSVMAEYIFKDIIKKENLEDKYYCESRGVSNEECGNDIYPLAKKCLDKHGVKYERHYARKISKEDIEEYDDIFVMDSYNLRNMKYLFGDVNKVKLLCDEDVSDPWPYGDFEMVYNQVVSGINVYLRG